MRVGFVVAPPSVLQAVTTAKHMVDVHGNTMIQQALAQFIRTELLGEAATTVNDPEAHIRETLAAIPISRLRQAGLLDLVLQLAQDSGENNSAPDVVLAAEAESIDDMDGEALLRLAIGDVVN